MENSETPDKIAPIDLGVVSTRSPDELAKRFLALSHRHRQLELQTLQLRHECMFVISLINRMEPSQDRVTALVAERLIEALKKCESEDIRQQLSADVTD